MSAILEKYNLNFSAGRGITVASSNSPLLSYYLSNSAITQATELYNGLKYFIQYYPGLKERDVILMKAFTIRLIAEDVQIICKYGKKQLDFPENIYTLPVDDLLFILQSWITFLTPYKVRDFEVEDGQGIIDIISDNFVTALVIEKAVAAIWPDCRGSIGEYYAVSRESYDKQKLLTENLTNALTLGSDEKIFEAVAVFLDLFATGKYKVIIGGVDVASAEIVYDVRMIYAEDVDENERFTYNLYHYSYGEAVLFSRSFNTINQNRVEEYVKIIIDGERPKILLFTNLDDEQSYVIDGHHKLLAYLQLGITAPAVRIEKMETVEHPHQNIIPQLLDILKPVEAMHLLQENRNIENLEVYISPGVTSYFDSILINEKTISTTLSTILYNAYNSTDAKVNCWIEGRLSVLRRNKNKGKGLNLYYREKKYMFKRLFIETEEDFSVWKRIFLEDGEIPDNLEEQQNKISEQYYSGYRSPEMKSDENNASILQTPYNTEDNWRWRFVAKVILMAILTFILIRACR